jgi:hypothetical protein
VKAKRSLDRSVRGRVIVQANSVQYLTASLAAPAFATRLREHRSAASIAKEARVNIGVSPQTSFRDEHA